MKILVMSCDNEQDTFELFHYCIEKNGPDHPEIIYSTETINNPYYKTICKNYSLEIGSKRIRETIKEIDDDIILIMCGDIFIRQPVNSYYIQYISNGISKNIVCLHFEANGIDGGQPYDDNGLYCDSGIRRSNMVALGNKQALLERFSVDLDPGSLEDYNDNTGTKIHLIRTRTDVFDGGKQGKGGQCGGILRGKWSRETIDFATANNIKLDLSRGIQEQLPNEGEEREGRYRLKVLDALRHS